MKTYFKFFRHTWLKFDFLPMCAWLFFVVAPIYSYHSFGGVWKLVFIPAMILALPVLIYMQVKVDEAEESQTKRSDGLTRGQLLDLWKLCSKFVKENEISCSETIYQTDRVILNASEFIEEITEKVGYFEYPEENK